MVFKMSAKLMDITQNGFIDEYASDFQSATANSKWNDAALTAHFQAGLRDEIKDLLISKDRSEKPSIFSLKSVELQILAMYRRLAKNQQLETCRQDGSIEDYISGFKTLAQGFEGHELSLVSYLYHGLGDKMKSTLGLADTAKRYLEALTLVLSTSRRRQVKEIRNDRRSGSD